MNSRFLETLVWVARLRSFTLAAERLNATQAAVSFRVASLEKDLGVRLLERDSRDVRLTTQGLLVLEQAEIIVQLYADLKQKMSSKSSIRRIVRLGVTDLTSLTLLPIIYKHINNEYENITIESKIGLSFDHYHALTNNEIDLALVSLPLHDTNLLNLALCDLSMDWVCSPKLGFPEGPIDVAELARFPIISYPRVSLPHHIIEKQFRGIEHPSVRLHLSGSLGMTIQLLVDAVGASVLPAVLVQRELAEGSLRLLSVREPFPTLRVSMSYLDVPENPLPLLIVPVCQQAAIEYCRQFESRFAKAYDQSSAEGGVLS